MSQLTSAQRYTISVMYKQGIAQKVVRKERLRRPRTFTGEVQNRVNRYMRKWQ